jgi:hypothetical protein
MLVGVAVASVAAAGCETQDDPASSGASPELREWRHQISQVARPGDGCFHASYPDMTWQAVPCQSTPAPDRAYWPRSSGLAPPTIPPGATVGNGVDVSAAAPAPLAWARGSFDEVIDVTSESSPTGANHYSLQLNTQYFPTVACGGSCRGFEQFIYESSGVGFMQYWMLDYGIGSAKCPSGWTRYPSGIEVHCFMNSRRSVGVPALPVSSLADAELLGVAYSSGDAVEVAVNGNVYAVSGDNRFPDLYQRWTTAEFNIFGDGNGDQAKMNLGAVLFVRTEVQTAAANTPSVDSEGFTADMNNMKILAGTAAVVPAQFDPYGDEEAPPAVTFVEAYE